MPSLDPLIENIFDSPNNPDVVLDQLTEKEEVSLGLVLVNLLDLLLEICQLRESCREFRVVLAPA